MFLCFDILLVCMQQTFLNFYLHFFKIKGQKWTSQTYKPVKPLTEFAIFFPENNDKLIM